MMTPKLLANLFCTVPIPSPSYPLHLPSSHPTFLSTPNARNQFYLLRQWIENVIPAFYDLIQGLQSAPVFSSTYKSFVGTYILPMSQFVNSTITVRTRFLTIIITITLFCPQPIPPFAFSIIISRLDSLHMTRLCTQGKTKNYERTIELRGRSKEGRKW